MVLQKRATSLAAVAALGLMLGAAGQAQAAIIPVPNASFESPVMADNGTTVGVQDWTSSGRTFTVNFTDSLYQNGTDTGPTGGVPTGGDGRNSVELDGVSSIQSANLTTVQALSTYNLTVAIGDFSSIEAGTARVGFLFNDVFSTGGPLSYVDFAAANYAPEATFRDFSFTYTPQASEVGSTLKVFLGHSGGDGIGYDNVRVTSSAAAVAPVPELGTNILLGLGVLIFAATQRRRKRKEGQLALSPSAG